MTALTLASFSTLTEGLTNVVKAAARWYRGRQAYHDLCHMDDRALSDIGLNRSDLRNASAVAMFEDPTGQLARATAVRRPYLGRRFMSPRQIASPSIQPLSAPGNPQPVR